MAAISKLLRASVACLLGGWLAVPGVALSMELVAQRLPEQVDVQMDAALSDPAWATAPVFDAFVQRKPVNGEAPPLRTTVQVLFNDEAVYVGIRAVDPHPQLIRASPGVHDSVGREQDAIMVLFDAVGSRKAAQYFLVNAVGSTADGMYTANTDYMDQNPDYAFTVHAARDDTGYVLVMRIPFSSLRYDLRNGTWRVLVRRMMSRDVAYEFASAQIPAGAPDLLVTMPLLVGLEPPEATAALQLSPSLLLTRTTSKERDQPTLHDDASQLSLDVRWQPLNAVIVNATVNPDFSQVESDVPQLAGNTRFALYLDEKRPFFQESSDFWQMPTEQMYTRAVTQPRWGLRATQRSENFAGTVFAVQDKGGGVVLLPGPWETASVDQPASRIVATRLRHDRATGHVALLGIERRYAEDAGSNQVLGTDFSLPFAEHLRLRGQWLTSSTSALPDNNGQLRRSATARSGQHLWASLEQHASDWKSDLKFEQLDAGFRNDSGFITQTGVRTVSLDVNRIWRNQGSLVESWWYLYALRMDSLVEGVGMYRALRPGWYFVHANGMEVTSELRVLEQQRSRPESVLHDVRYLHLELHAQPATWMPMLETTLDVGQLLDVVSDQVNSAHSVMLDLQFRLSTAALVTVGVQHQGDGMTRSRRYSEFNWQLDLDYALGLEHHFRAVVLRKRLQRMQPEEQRTEQHARTVSLAYRWTWQRYRELYLGVTREQGDSISQSSDRTQAYLKAVVDFSL